MKELSPLVTNWIEHSKKLFNETDLDLIITAFTFSEEFNEKCQPEFSNSALEQGLNMATELRALNCDPETLGAAIVYPVIYYGKINKSLIEKKLGKNISKLLASAKKIESVQPLLKTISKNKIDNFRKMMLAIVDDIRIVLIKLAECLVILKFFRNHDLPEKIAIAQQAMDVYAPLANRLGIWQLKWQLEDLAFRYLHQKEYQEIKKALKMRRNDREQYISRMIKQLMNLFEQIGLDKPKITGRAKHIYSIYKKMRKKQIPFEQLYDTIAFRILVPSLEDCYKTLSIVHGEWPHIKQEFDDYIAKPKPNGYQSIHTAITGPNKMNIEIQIRTFQMHQDAELGVAAHWKYKEGGKQGYYEEKINRLRKILAWQKEEPHGENDVLYSKVFEDKIYVFTPEGDIFDLNAGSTPIDFAYHVHTEIGHRCRGAKVNGVLVPLTHKLKTGDRVEILTSKESKPSRDWINPNLKFIATTNARNKIRRWFQKMSYTENLEAGEIIWEKHCRRENIKRSEITKAYQHFNFKNHHDLLVAIGNNEIGVTSVSNYLKNISLPTKTESHEEALTLIKRPAIAAEITSGLVIEGVGNLLTNIAKCCKPIPGDPIIAYVTKGRGASIHHQSCNNIKQALQYRPERVLEVCWGKQKIKGYPVSLTIQADNRAGLMRDVTALVANKKIAILGVQSHVDLITDNAYINLTVEVENIKIFDKLLTHLQHIPAIISVKRI